MSLHHSFDIDIAAEYGIEEALLIHHFAHWVRHNRDNGTGFVDGRTWTYQTREWICSHFPYLNPQKVRRIVERLVKKKVLIVGNFNKNQLNKTLWYAFENEEMFTKGRNDKSPKPICEQGKQENVPSHSDLSRRAETTNGRAETTNRSVYSIKDTREEDKKKTASLLSFGSHVKLKKEDYEAFVAKHSREKITELIEAMNDYCLASNPKGYRDYAAALRQWLRREADKKPMVGYKTNQKTPRQIAEKLMNHPKLKGRIHIGPDYLDFANGTQSVAIKFDDKDFVGKIKFYTDREEISIE